jgi:hypothetical protein
MFLVNVEEQTYDWSNQPVEFLCGYTFAPGDDIRGDFGDHILIRCPINQEDYRIYYHISEGRKVLHTLARLEL